jgi:hypothetical protein
MNRYFAKAISLPDFTMQPHLRAAALLLFIAALPSCSSESTRPSVPVLEGAYTATAFTVTTSDTTIDEVAEGVTLALTLSPDGTTAGTLVVPPFDPLTLVGTWDTTGATVHFDETATTFLNFMPFQVGPNRLDGVLAEGAGTLRVTLAK